MQTSGKKMSPRRERFQIDYLKLEICEGNTMTTGGHMDRLRSKKDSHVLHVGIKAFLEDLYGGK